MHQAGIIAGGALYAIENNVTRLKDDHNNAKHFAEEISRLPYVVIDMESVQTNIVIFNTTKDASKIREVLEGKGILLTNDGKDKMRAVFHMDVSVEQTAQAIEIFKTLKA